MVTSTVVMHAHKDMHTYDTTNTAECDDRDSSGCTDSMQKCPVGYTAGIKVR